MYLNPPFRIALACLAFALAGGCSHWSAARHVCNPLGRGEGEDCLLPFPSSFYTRPDPTTATGLRVDLRDAALPVSSLGAALDPAPYDRRDGFSAVSTLLAYFPERIAPIGLPAPGHAEESLSPASAVQLIRFDTGERVPVFAELDANADSASDRQGLIIQPMERLRPRTRYVAAIQGVRARDGRELRPLRGFALLRNGGVPPGSTLDGEKAKYEEIFATLARDGIARSRVQLAWDFTTGSDEQLSGRLVRMRDEALRPGREPASAAAEAPIQVLSDDFEPRRYPDLLRRLVGTYEVRSFLEDGDGERLRLGPDGEPEAGRLERFPLVIHVPACAREAKGPLPVLVYGHGTFNSAENEMASDYSRGVLNRLCMIEVGTDWLGRAKKDLAPFLVKVLPNWNNFPLITDRLQQAHVNFSALARLIRSGALDSMPQLQWKGRPLVDSRRIYYYGISEGGCQGVTALALSPDFDRGALNVPCGFWSMFFWRSSDFHYARWALKLSYPGALERQKLMALSQLLWDYTDPANYGGHLLRNPLPGSTAKRILYQEGINDASVPNLTTRAMARTIGLKLLRPYIEKVPGVQDASGPLGSGYAQFDVGVRPRLGGDNVPPAKNPVHEDIRRLEASQAQLERFLREDGAVVDTCSGRPCVFSEP